MEQKHHKCKAKCEIDNGKASALCVACDYAHAVWEKQRIEFLAKCLREQSLCMSAGFINERTQSRKPPLGITPRYIRDEQRREELKQAINRYFEANNPIPIEWIWEYNELVGGTK